MSCSVCDIKEYELSMCCGKWKFWYGQIVKGKKEVCFEYVSYFLGSGDSMCDKIITA